jgi:hypothetical protein
VPVTTHPVPEPTGTDDGALAYTHWTPEEWIAEAVAQYGRANTLMRAWMNVQGMATGSAAETMTYKQAANHTQAAIAAASIASAKLGWDMTDG